MAMTSAHEQKKRQGTYSAGGTKLSLDHYRQTILQSEAVVSGVTIYYAVIRNKIEENRAHCDDPDAFRSSGLPCDLRQQGQA
jgi:hypothetical protein